VKHLVLAADPEQTVTELRSFAPPPAEVAAAVAQIVGDVRAQGDAAVRAHTARLDKVDLPEEYGLPAAALQAARAGLRPELRAALELAAANIRAYHEREAPKPWRERLAQGQVVGQNIVPLAVAGLYVPGGLADYPSSVLMTVIPAQVAGVGRIVVCSPPRPDGGVAAGVAAACALLGVDDVLPVGGAQAVAAMAFGTDVVPRCDVIAGPGNAYVTEAKRQVMGQVRIDGLAGPSEVLIVADETGDPAWLAADLLAQAEHGAGAMGALLDIGGTLGDEVATELGLLCARLNVFVHNVAVVSCADREAALDFVNRFAPEHLELHLPDAAELLPRVRNAGAVFCGPYAATAFADYAAGTNHVLPTGGAARFGQGLSTSEFVKRMAVLELDATAAAALAPAVVTIALEERLTAHARSAELRAGPSAWPSDRAADEAARPAANDIAPGEGT
jgi:histidinol dehydrogenase